MNWRAPAAAARTSTSVALSSATTWRASRMVSGRLAAPCSMLSSVLVIESMFSSESTALARPTRSGRLERNRSKFERTESMTGYCSLGTDGVLRAAGALASRSM